MFLISCPYCGARSGEEFTFERPVEAIVPLDAPPAQAMRRLYSRTNPKGPSLELWRHAHGCGAWLAVQRDTASHAVVSVGVFEGKA